MHTSDKNKFVIAPWALEMKGISIEQPSPLVRSLTSAIVGHGGWVLRRGAQDSGLLNLLFEFEQQSSVEIYSTLIGAGVELSQSGHVRLTQLCSHTLGFGQASDSQIASIDLEIQTFPTERIHASRAGLLT